MHERHTPLSAYSQVSSYSLPPARHLMTAPPAPAPGIMDVVQKPAQSAYRLSGIGDPGFGGDPSAPTTLGIVLAVGLIAGVGWLSYQAGSAMAPRPSSRKTWGMVGIPLGLFTGPLGLGIMGAVSNQGK